ncbi:Bulb-type lectin domain [Dillenia turbinata]|uniref:Bulb-type lectin domain n=1 Tax=Dillenia turbinata TaxID=194707 RepID=A0AAN8ZQX3_9MAGN
MALWIYEVTIEGALLISQEGEWLVIQNLLSKKLEHHLRILMKEFSFLLNLLFIYILSNMIVSTAVDTIAASQLLRDGETIVSTGGSFELGFFSPGSSTKRYLGIWYHKIASGTVVWVANRETPINNTFGVLMVEEPGILVLRDHTNHKIWSSNSSRRIQTPIAQLLDSGNLIVRDGNDSDSQNFLWQSFDFPCDTFLPGMKFGRNSTSGLDRYISSWKSTDDPSPGDFVYRLDPNGFPQFLLFKGSIVQFRSGPWNGLRFSGIPPLKANPFYKFWFVFNQEKMYYTYELLNTSVVSRMVLGQNGIFQRFTWINRTQGWKIYISVPLDNCDTYAFCGPYSSCNIDDSPVCACLKGFVPKFPNEWDKVDWSNGCVRKIPLECGKGDGFIKYSGIKLPDTRYSWFNVSMNLKECKMKCLNNCSCRAYANLDIRGGGSGCLLWFDDLIDIRQLTENGQDLYIRMAASELGKNLWPNEGNEVFHISIRNNKDKDI